MTGTEEPDLGAHFTVHRDRKTWRNVVVIGPFTLLKMCFLSSW